MNCMQRLRGAGAGVVARLSGPYHRFRQDPRQVGDCWGWWLSGVAYGKARCPVYNDRGVPSVLWQH